MVIIIEDDIIVFIEKMKEESVEDKSIVESIVERGFLVGLDGDFIKLDFKVIFYGLLDCEKSVECFFEG